MLDEDCHWILPVFPDKVNKVLFVPVQTEDEPVIDPATDNGFTVIVAIALFVEEHTPLVTTAL